MEDPATLAKLSVEAVKRQIEHQRLRIVRQKNLIAKLDRQKYTNISLEVRLSLEKMEDVLVRMTAKLAAANEELFRATVDEPTLEMVERDCPM
jgi:molybdopterin/thiamine biosynthesis adenylyltransferase